MDEIHDDEGLTLTFLGFGQVAVALSQRLISHGATVRAYDVNLGRAGGLNLLRARAGSLPIEFLGLVEAMASANVIFSVVPPRQALSVVNAVREHIKSGQLFVDAASVGPAEKSTMSAIIDPTGAEFVDAAIVEAIATAGSDARILLSGSAAGRAVGLLARRGLNVVDYGAEVGKAATFKMLRGVLSKGLEALLLEVMTAARRSGVEADLWTEFDRLFAERGFRSVGENWIASHGTAYERRYWEVIQVIQTLEDLDIDHPMTTATLGVFERSRQLALKDILMKRPASAQDVLDTLLRVSSGGSARV